MSKSQDILSPNGTRLPKTNGTPRPELASLKDKPRRRRPHQVSATYDAARDSDDFKNYWANADSFDADSANSRAVRSKLVPRSRYEIGNNGYADGITQTYATDVVGVGPKLHMETGSQGFNQLVEQQFHRWSKAIKFRRKLWCMCHAKCSDGESFGVLRTNPRNKHDIQLDVVLYETEQCQTVNLPYSAVGYIDGIKFDKFGNPEHYDFLRTHPGSGNGYSLKAEQVPAEFVLHWFMLRRPGQHRGIPEQSSTLNTGAASRRWREATLAAAESAADIAALLTSTLPPNSESDPDPVAPMSTLEFEKRMLTALPMGWDARQMKAEHPHAQYEAFHKQLINEQARPKSMPYNKAACDSSDYNYASGRLDHQTYYGALDVDREDCNDLVLDPLFDVWFDEAVRHFGWLGGNPDAINISHSWDWPKHRVADIRAEALASDIELKNGSRSLTAHYAARGEDFKGEALPALAEDFGVSVPEMQKILMRNLYPEVSVAKATETQDDDDDTNTDTD